MSAWTADTRATASPLAPLVDPEHLGSPGGQALVGIAGIVLAIVLVLGQISLATTKGIAGHLHNTVAHLEDGNHVMESVVARAKPAVQLDSQLAAQQTTLARTRRRLTTLNATMTGLATTSTTLGRTVQGMETSSAGMSRGVSGIASSTNIMTTRLGTLPAATDRTHRQLQRINGDTNAINAELKALGAKMSGYGFPKAQGAPTG